MVSVTAAAGVNFVVDGTPELKSEEDIDDEVLDWIAQVRAAVK